ncbi:MAG: hypothetical protein KGL39_45890 [Patescibacteria group bacterium]|nr:hypothetical protein [Patescibacteria group bacterium]
MWEAFAKLLTDTVPVEMRTRIVACVAFVGLVGAGWVAPQLFAKESQVQAIVTQLTTFARETEVNDIEKDIKESRAESDKNAILQLRQTECLLPQGASKAIYTETIATRMQDYFRITGQGFQEPSCSDF